MKKVVYELSPKSKRKCREEGVGVKNREGARVFHPLSSNNGHFFLH
jgi:hypothetical protein